jgi:hypothetical protein
MMDALSTSCAQHKHHTQIPTSNDNTGLLVRMPRTNTNNDFDGEDESVPVCVCAGARSRGPDDGASHGEAGYDDETDGVRA